jgi:hypothetical protein
MGGQVTTEMQWRRASAPSNFTMITCGGFNVYAVDSSQQFWRLNHESILDCSWRQMDGRGVWIEGTEGKQLWCTNASDEIFFYYHGWTSTRWERVPEGRLVMVSVGKGQYVWGINREGQIFKTNETSKKWVQMPGNAVNLSVGRDGSCWCVNAQSEIFRWVSKDFLGYDGHWEKMPGQLRQISVYDDHTVVGTNHNDDIWYWDRVVNDWKQFAGKLRHVSVGATNYAHVWGVNAQGEVWFHRNAIMDGQLERARRAKHEQHMNAHTGYPAGHGTTAHVSHGSPAQVGYQVSSFDAPSVSVGGFPASGVSVHSSTNGVQVTTSGFDVTPPSVNLNVGGFPSAGVTVHSSGFHTSSSGVQVSTGFPSAGVSVSTSSGYPATGGVQVSTGFPGQF